MSAVDTRAAAVAGGVRPRRFGGWYAAEHRLLGIRAYLGTALATGIASPYVYLYALGVGLATVVDRGTDANQALGVSFLVFVAPALLATSAMTVASEEFSYPIFGGFKWNPVFQAMNASPLTPAQIIDGQVVGVAIRMAPTCIAYFAFMLLFGAVPLGTGFLAIGAAVLTGMAIGVMLMAYVATLTQDTGQIAMVMRFVITPLSLFSGTFFPLTQFPVWLQWIGWISPLWHGSELGRVATYGMEEPLWLTVAHVAYLLLWLAVGWTLSRRVATRRLRA
ncbi:ABC transporter permease [Clavibacter nebraskensis]|uniref:Transport permease protein n=2 Tax=Clavibacter nebraskensis TaxID=31963 RepID=A0A399PTZ5_9MICO|nr:ABC transporter permease [Clavibacter nebraskensis]KXU21395.1 ABC transporter [Clavibacter nebraskensis]OAH20202.1 ABC transporter [Clavibacter nebraskensis]QGV66146.1 ABC transporter permease [Clavibacter nebraskensis]QGV68944.1 ABC transporter permease [Clavibacter nebraskensis]QGV71734.1 ABC transporter permease [Clavibacter nebraskensis]